MRCIDADALIHELKNSHYPGEPDVNAGIGIAIGKVWDAPTIEPEPSIPISWIEGHIDWLKDMDNGFANITAMNIETMLRKWREEQIETD